jgi:tyrosyl-DNA phosphodiesterase 2
VWFGAHRFEERVPLLIDAIGRADADVIALQEVTPEFNAYLRAAPWADDYAATARIGDYGCVLASRLPVTRAAWHVLPTRMGRTLVVMDVIADGVPVTLATVHLESMASETDTRVRQLVDIFPILGGCHPTRVLCGDMNFTPDDAAETAAVTPGWTDVWAALRPADPGFTMDSERNAMRWEVKPKVTRKRLDRVFTHGAALEARAIALYGDQPAPGDPTLFASDHFALCARFEIVR